MPQNKGDAVPARATAASQSNPQAVSSGAGIPIASPTPIWSCKIGTQGQVNLPPAADAPMRRAVETVFRQITGVDCDYNFSGWSAELNEHELAVVENRLPSEEHHRQWLIQQAAPSLLEALQRLCREADPLDRIGLADAFEQAEAALTLALGEQS